MQLAENKTHMEYVFLYYTHKSTGGINPGQPQSTHSLGDEPPAVAASGGISAQREKLKERNTGKSNISQPES